MIFFKRLEELLSINKDYVDNNGLVIKSRVQDDALKLSPGLIKLLLNNEETRRAFFTNVEGTLVFDKVQFSWILSNKLFLPDSYTRFTNKIGLADETNTFLINKNEVILSFPYKDCCLEGGQTKEAEKRKEIFFNETLNKSEIDVMLEPKVITNYREYRHDEGDTSEIKNYIIKGNNLIVLHSLLPRYEGKVQLIFIDPPYNTDNDTFGYNDSFNRSTWLVFMKNRLEVAKKLLAKNGSIYVSIDYNEVHYLKVLMDEIFPNGFKREIIWRIGWLSGYKTAEKNYIRNHDTILFYTMNPNDYIFNKVYNTIDDYQDRFNDEQKRLIAQLLTKNGIESKDKIKEILDYISKVGLPEKYPLEDTWNSSIYDKLNSIAVVSFSGEKVSKMLGTDEFKGQKSEHLIKRIIEASSNEGDLVLDFFLGTGTTSAVAHKLNRNYIGIEQLDYFDSVTIERMKKVIGGEENTGITKDVSWTGGGSFAKFELKMINQEFINRIVMATDVQMDTLFDLILNSPFVTYKINISDVVQQKADFNQLNISDKKRFLVEILDKNMLYVNLSDMNDDSMGVSEEEKAITSSFYGVK